MRKAETSYRHTRQTLISILWTIADTRQGCSAHVCSCLHSDRVSLSVLVASCHMACKSAMKRKARSVRKSTSKAKKPPRMTPDEKRIAREMHFERGMGRKDVATALGRDLSSICKPLKQKKTPRRIGPPVKFTEEKVDKKPQSNISLVIQQSLARQLCVPAEKVQSTATSAHILRASAGHSRATRGPLAGHSRATRGPLAFSVLSAHAVY